MLITAKAVVEKEAENRRKHETLCGNSWYSKLRSDATRNQVVAAVQKVLEHVEKAVNVWVGLPYEGRDSIFVRTDQPEDINASAAALLQAVGFSVRCYHYVEDDPWNFGEISSGMEVSWKDSTASPDKSAVEFLQLMLK